MRRRTTPRMQPARNTSAQSHAEVDPLGEGTLGPRPPRPGCDSKPPRVRVGKFFEAFTRSLLAYKHLKTAEGAETEVLAPSARLLEAVVADELDDDDDQSTRVYREICDCDLRSWDELLHTEPPGRPKPCASSTRWRMRAREV